jgi:signal transduction histidine kinase
VKFDANVEHLELDPEQTIALYRTAQESLTNVARHAQASSVEVRLTLAGGALHLLVADDGRGITPDEIGQPGSLGLVGMRERIASVGGELSIEGLPGQGTRINVRLPLAPPVQ